jgi:hypothetical protein
MKKGIQNTINNNKYDTNKCARLQVHATARVSSELLVFRNATGLKSGHSATETE